MRLALLVVALLAVPGPVAANWLQPGYDGGRHSVTADSGPAWPDVALHLDGDAFRSKTTSGQYSHDAVSDPIIVNGTAYLMRHAQPADSPRHCLELYRVDMLAISVRTGAVHVVETFDPPRCLPTPIASDGRWIYVAVHDRVLAYDPITDTWPLDMSVRVENATAAIPAVGSAFSLSVNPYTSCGGIALGAGKAYLACTAGATTWYGAYAYLAIVDVAALTLTTHLLRLPDSPEEPPGPANSNRPVEDVAYQGIPGSLAVQGIAASDGLVAVTVYGVTDLQLDSEGTSPDDGTATQTAYVWLLDDAGTILNARALTPPGRGYHLLFPASPILIEGAVLQRNQGFSLLTPDSLESRPGFRDDAVWEWDAGSTCAVADDALYCAFSHRLYRLDHDFGVAWRQDLPAGQVWAPGSLIVADGVLYGLAIRLFGETTVIAKETQKGTDLWTHRAPAVAAQARFAIADGLLVMHHEDGDVTVLGTAPFSLKLNFDAPGRYPGTGELIRIDLGRSGQGIGSVLEYSADWGDGSIMDWTADPVLQHRYASPEDFMATFYVRNDAGQTARSAPLTFHVGQDDPAVNIFNSPFSDQYQETSFFILGLLITAVAAAFGLYRAGRKRRRLERELRDLEQEHGRLQADPPALERMLAERKARARALFLEKKLEEAHASFLERRVDELRQALRLTAVDEKLKFLPYGMVQQLRRVLVDGRIDAWERSHFLEALDREADLADAQRRQVRGLIDAWFERDVGAG